MSDRRLIEAAFPLRQASLDSVHEKNIRHGHISTLHIWPARRPLAACRAALLATLLPDPGTPEQRRRLVERIGGKVVEEVRRKRRADGSVEETRVERTEGGVLHWGRESDPELAALREEIRAAFGGRAPRVLDPFAGGGAIPLEAMRLGCEVTAGDLNPVAWFLLKCTLEYPQRLAGDKRRLPDFVLGDRGFMEAYLKGQGLKGKGLRDRLQRLGLSDEEQLLVPTVGVCDPILDADLAWHVRAWGHWVLERARADLAPFYPVVDGQTPVAYLWARTVRCKGCRATIPLLKTRWLCRKERKRVRLTMEPNADRTGVVFGIEHDVPPPEGTPAERREHDRRLGAGTMTRSGAKCPCCPAIMTSADIRLEGRAGRLGTAMTAVVVSGEKGKEYRLPEERDLRATEAAAGEMERVFETVPDGLPDEPVPRGGSRAGGGSPFTVYLYGLDRWAKLFTPRQLVALGTFVRRTRDARQQMATSGYDGEWVEGVSASLAAAVDRVADAGSALAHWQSKGEFVTNTFQRFALPIKWDTCEASPTSSASGSYLGALDWVGRAMDHILAATAYAPVPEVRRVSAIANPDDGGIDVVLTDPPYYDAIPYSDLMDFFHVWLRRTLRGLSPELDEAFDSPLGPKWDHDTSDGELIDDASRFDGDRRRSTAVYEDGMYRAFSACHAALKPDGRLVVVFAHKQPDAWESLVSAIIRAGFVVTGSWPIQTERQARTRSLSSAALASSVWLVCRKRPATARPGWDERVLGEMHENVTERLREFWDARIRGPDFVWAATGPALEAYSRHPVVKKADEPGEVLGVGEFLRHVRRMVVDFVVGRVLSEAGAQGAAAELDDVTTYYLLHRHDFGLDPAPVGACILYAVSCGLSDRDLADRLDLLAAKKSRRGGGDDADDEEEAAGSSGSEVRLKRWKQRRRKTMGFERPGGGPVPLVDQVHRLMHLWRGGDRVAVDDYVHARGLDRHVLFVEVLQALVELAPEGSEERSLLERIAKHLAAEGAPLPRQLVLRNDEEGDRP